MPATVLLVESNEILRKGIGCALARSRSVRRLVEADSGSRALALAEREPIDAVIVGTDVLRDDTGLIDRILSRGSRSIVIAHDDSGEALECGMRSGAAALLGSASGAEELRQALDSLLASPAGSAAPTSERSAEAASRRKESPTARLTARERTVLRWIGIGESNGEIAARLGISRRTVDTHRLRLMRKLGIHKTAGLVRYAVREGLVQA